MTRTTMKIDGMSCGHCVASVRKALDRLDGVTVENVGVGSATVEYDPKTVSPQSIADAISATGYSAAPASEARLG
jgi:copper chaperone CopZ